MKYDVPVVTPTGGSACRFFSVIRMRSALAEGVPKATLLTSRLSTLLSVVPTSRLPGASPTGSTT